MIEMMNVDPFATANTATASSTKVITYEYETQLRGAIVRVRVRDDSLFEHYRNTTESESKSLWRRANVQKQKTNEECYNTVE